MQKRKRLTTDDYDVIYNIRCKAGVPGTAVSRMTGLSTPTIYTVEKLANSAFRDDWNSVADILSSGALSPNVALSWLKDNMNLDVPTYVSSEIEGGNKFKNKCSAPEQARVEKESERDLSTQTNDDMFLLKLITEQAAQTAVLRSTAESVTAISDDIRKLLTQGAKLSDRVYLIENAVHKLTAALLEVFGGSADDDSGN